MDPVKIEKGPIHIGERDLPNWPPKIGTTWETIFYLQNVPEKAILRAEVFSTNKEHNEVFINDRRIGHLALNTGNQYVSFDLSIPSGILRKGENKFFLQAAKWGSEHEPYFDNFLIRNISIV